MQELRDIEFVVFDVETTGLSTEMGDRIIEVATLKIMDGEEIDRFQTLVNPQREVSFQAFLVNQISSDMLVAAPKFSEILPQITSFIGDSCLIGHNIRFDLNFLNNEFMLNNHSQIQDNLTIDTVRMARGFMPELRKYSLSFVTQALGIRVDQTHRAMADVELTYQVFCALVKKAREKDMAQLSVLTNLFGVHKRKKLKKQIKLDIISEAISTRASLNLLYLGISHGATTRTVTPREVRGKGREAVLVGHCHLRGEERNFRIDRIINLEKQ